MAVIAKAEITISKIASVEKITRYYLLQPSTAAVPSKPADGSAISSNWSKTEPSYTSGSTNTLYFVDQTILSDDAIKYSEVSKSSSYEAAKEAWNKANNAQNTADSANDKIDGLQVGGRNLLTNSRNINVWYCKYGNNPIHSVVRDTGTYIVNGQRVSNPIKVTFKVGGSGDMRVSRHLSTSGDVIDFGSINMANRTYVFSVWVYSDVNVTLQSFMTRCYGDMDGSDNKHQISAQTWTRITHIRTYSDRTDLDGIRLRFGVTNVSSDVNLFFALAKLDEGTIATDWTPAPEDIEEATEEAKKMATDYITQDETGMTVGNKQYDRNVHISPTDISIRKGETNLARFADSLIELGLSRDFVLQILNNAIRFMSSDGSAAIAYIGYGDCRALPDTSGEGEVDIDYVIASRPYYTLGIRSDNYSEPNISAQVLSSDIGEYSVAIGQEVEASGPNSYAEGHLTVAYGYVSHAEGDMTKALGSYTHAEGVGTNAHGDISHAEGSGSEAIGFTSHSEGNSTVASGTCSHAEGDNTVASGEASHAAGRGTIADNDAQTAVGRYNLKNSANLFSVGNGTSDESRSNAFAVGTDGQTFASSNTHTKGNFVTDENNHGVYLRRTDRTTAQELLLDSGNNLSIGYGQWENGNGTVLRAGSDITFGIKNYGATVYRPYYRKGDSLTMEWRGAGYVTASSGMVWFAIPFSKPVIGNPTVTVTSVNGLILRQSGKYICGTAASTWKKPSSIQCSRYADFLYIGCKMSATTNAVNNDSVGIEASIKITFS